MSSPTVLVLNGELGFMFALSLELTRRQISVVPARTAREARSSIAKFGLEPDLLLINCSSPGACALADEISKGRREIRVIAIVSDRYHCNKCADRLAARFRDPDDKSPERIPHCAAVIERLLKEQQDQSRRAGGN